MSKQGSAEPAIAQPSGDEGYGTQCPFCLSTVPGAAVICSGCGARKSLRGARHPIARLFLWSTLFGSIWIAGGAAAVGPWTQKDTGLHELTERQCVQYVRIEQRQVPGVTIPSEPGTIAIADRPCGEVSMLRDRVDQAIAVERRAHPNILYRVSDSPRTVPRIRLATAGNRQLAFAQRLGISLGGFLFLIVGTWIGNGLWRWAFGKATDPVWVR